MGLEHQVTQRMGKKHCIAHVEGRGLCCLRGCWSGQVNLTCRTSLSNLGPWAAVAQDGSRVKGVAFVWGHLTFPSRSVEPAWVEGLRCARPDVINELGHFHGCTKFSSESSQVWWLWPRRLLVGPQDPMTL